MAEFQYQQSYIGANAKPRREEGQYEEVHTYASVTATQPSEVFSSPIQSSSTSNEPPQQVAVPTASMKSNSLKRLTLAFVVTTVIFTGVLVVVFVMLTASDQIKSEEEGIEEQWIRAMNSSLEDNNRQIQKLQDELEKNAEATNDVIEQLKEAKAEIGELKNETIRNSDNIEVDRKELEEANRKIDEFKNETVRNSKKLEAIQKGVFTCEQLKKIDGTKVPGVYTMSLSSNSYQVHCDFSSGEAVTEVWHDSMQEIQIPSCEDYGCYTRTPRYEIDQNSILKIIENSRECRQFIKWRCKGSMLFNGGGYGWWVSRQGSKMTYWGGATSRRNKYCACGETGTCVDNKYKCNCDDNDSGITTQDEGFLTDKSKLPVKTLRFGDAGASSEAGWHTLGKLECMGQA